ncbi:acyl-CoA dehydrogenase family protein [Sodalis sp. dw_96]|uniref:acyl-CoA dehydrogenase family protein n=1 Tax=Sodalis sp. dw_96 TaxID=2719794 RepID=UPI001BD2D423|nr:acyl-CoA dehydrogenase family protein [Sodalis sp. dw_96]
MTDSVQIISSAAQALEAARALADVWSRSAAEIDAQRRVPVAELDALSRSGLLAITVPREFGGAGVATETLIEVFLILAEVDTALAQIPQNHFDFVDTLLVAEHGTRAFFYDQLLSGARFGNALAEPGRPSRRDIATTIIAEGKGFRLNGRKYFSTGALTAQWVPVFGKATDGRILTAYIERGNPGLDILADWDAFGQRGTFSGTTLINDVWVPASQVVDRGRGDPAILIAQFAGNQLIHAAIETGSASGALRAAAGILGDHGRLNDNDLARLGEYAVRVSAAKTLVRRAARRVDAVLGHDAPSAYRTGHLAGSPADEPPAIDAPSTREIAPASNAPSVTEAYGAFIATDEAKSVAYELSPALANDIAHFRVSRVNDEHRGLDRLWRNVRTHSLHDPVRWRQFYVGDFYLNGTLPGDIAVMAGGGSSVKTHEQ